MTAEPPLRLILDSVSCHVYFFGDLSSYDKTPLFIMPSGENADDLMEYQHKRLDPYILSGKMPPHAMAVFETKNWNDDLSLWPAHALGKGQPDFGGFAQKTLEWIQESLIPAVISLVPPLRDSPKGLMGYSLGGLFAVWAVCRIPAFAVCASCSGSLWYEGFVDYLERHGPAAPCSLYISLGEKEEKARNPRLAMVGEAARQTVALFKASAMAREVELAWHPGGHGSAADERLTVALEWMKNVCH